MRSMVPLVLLISPLFIYVVLNAALIARQGVNRRPNFVVNKFHTTKF